MKNRHTIAEFSNYVLNLKRKEELAKQLAEQTEDLRILDEAVEGTEPGTGLHELLLAGYNKLSTKMLETELALNELEHEIILFQYEGMFEN